MIRENGFKGTMKKGALPEQAPSETVYDMKRGYGRSCKPTQTSGVFIARTPAPRTSMMDKVSSWLTGILPVSKNRHSSFINA
jgi:hypothetical protein